MGCSQGVQVKNPEGAQANNGRNPDVVVVRPSPQAASFQAAAIGGGGRAARAVANNARGGAMRRNLGEQRHANAGLTSMEYRELTPEDLIQLSMLPPVEVPKPTKLDPKEVSKVLPRHRADECRACSECPVCLVDFEPHHIVARLPCQHAFCESCIADWLAHHHLECPCCRAPVNIADLTSESSTSTSTCSESRMASDIEDDTSSASDHESDALDDHGGLATMNALYVQASSAVASTRSPHRSALPVPVAAS